MGGLEGLQKAEFGFPGPLRDRLVKAILDGHKTATASLRIEYGPTAPEPMPTVGAQSVVVDSDDRPVALIETTRVEVLRFDEVGLRFARDEGEGFESVADWRGAHTRFWESDEMRAELGRPEFRVADDTLVVTEYFRLVEIEGGPSSQDSSANSSARPEYEAFVDEAVGATSRGQTPLRVTHGGVPGLLLVLDATHWQAR